MKIPPQSDPKARRRGLILFLLGAAVFVLGGFLWRPSSSLTLIDFKPLYYPSQLLLRHQDPYIPADVLARYSAAVGPDASLAPVEATGISVCINLPSILVLVAPLALLPWSVAQALWSVLLAVGFVFAAWLMWRIGAAWSPAAAAMISFLLFLGSLVILEVGNSAGLAVSFCAIAAAAIVHNRFARIGVVLLALSLLMKPQDAGLVWLYFLLAGGTYRRRAWQTLGLVAVVLLVSVAWVQHVAPHWRQELQANVRFTTSPGRVNDPSPEATAPEYRGAMTVSLQTISSIFFRNPTAYNLLAYLLCAPLLAAWAWAVLRARPTIQNAWFALAAIAPLSMLPVYHRQYDTRLMILAIPACALLYARRGKAGKWALAITALAAILSAQIFVQILGLATYDLRHAATGFEQQLLTLALARPIPIAMFVMSLFYCGYWARTVFAGAPRWATDALPAEEVPSNP